MQKGKGGYGVDLMGALFNFVAAAKGGWKGGGGNNKAGRGRGKGDGKGAEGKGVGAKGKGQGGSGYVHAEEFDPEWPCPKCGPGNGTRNRQNRTHCRACGAPRPSARGQPKGGAPGPVKTPSATTRPTGVDGRRPILGCRDSSWKNGTASAAGPRAPSGPTKRETEHQRREPMGRGLTAAGSLRDSISYATMAARANPAGKGDVRDKAAGAVVGQKGYAIVDYGKGVRPRVGRFGPLAEEEDEDPRMADQEDEAGETEYHDMADNGEQLQRQQLDQTDDDDRQHDDAHDGDDGGGQTHDDDAEEDETQDAVEQAKEELGHRQEIHRCTRNSRGRNHPATIRARRDVEEAQKKLAEARGPRKWWVQVRKHERRLEAIDRAEEKLEEEWQKAEELFQQQAYEHQEHQQAMQEKFDDFRAEKAAIRADIAAIKRQPLDAHHDADDHEQPSQECAEAKLKVKLMGKKIAGILDMVEGNHKVHQELASINMDLADLENLVGDSAWWYDEAASWDNEEVSDADGQWQLGGGGAKNRWSGGSRSAQSHAEAAGKGAAPTKGTDETRPMEVGAARQTTGARRPADSDSQGDRGGKQAKCAEQRVTDGTASQGGTGAAATGAPSPAAAAAQKAAEFAAAQAAEAVKEARRQRAMDALRARLLAQQQRVLEAQQQAANVSANQAHARTEQQLEEMARQIEAINNEVAAQAEKEWEALSAEAKEELLEQYA